MKTKVIALSRLYQFAQHIEKIKNHPEEGLFRTIIIYAIEGKDRIQLEVRTPYWVFEELVSCFPNEWSFDEKTGDPIWDEMKVNTNTSECVCEFFGIDNYELFCHLWDVDGYQTTEKWGGNKLTEFSSGQDIAYNIFQYIKSQS